MSLPKNATVMSRAERTTSPPPSSSAASGVSSACIMSELDRCIKHREQAIEDDDDEDRFDHRGGDMLAQRFGAAAHLHALDRGDRADNHRHEGRLYQARENRADVDGGTQPVDKGGRRDTGIEI